MNECHSITTSLGTKSSPVVNVRMSPQFAKEFAELLQNNIKMFEDKFGVIKVFKPEVN